MFSITRTRVISKRESSEIKAARKMATDNYTDSWLFWISSGTNDPHGTPSSENHSQEDAVRESGWVVGSRGILRDATLRLRREGSSKARTLDSALSQRRGAGVSEAKRVRSFGPTSFLSLRRSSALPAAPRHANIDCRPSPCLLAGSTLFPVLPTACFFCRFIFAGTLSLFTSDNATPKRKIHGLNYVSEM